VVVYANDTSGNMGASSTVHFTVDTTPPNITNVSQTSLENNMFPEDEVKVNATVFDSLSGVKQVFLNYTNGNGTWVTVEMTNLEGNIWKAKIPAFPHGTNTTYIIMAEDNQGNAITTEKLGYKYQYKEIPEFPSILIPPLLITAILIAIIIYRKKRAMAPARKSSALEKPEDTQRPTGRRTIVLLTAIAIAISAIGVSWYLLQPKSQDQEGVLATDFSLVDVEGNSFQLSSFRGKVVLLDFMTTWCGGCRAEIPHLGEIWQKEDYENKIVIVSINIDPGESAETLKSFAQEFPYATWIWARDTANLAQVYEVAYVPKIVIIDTDGYIRFKHYDVTGASALMSEIDQLLS